MPLNHKGKKGLHTKRQRQAKKSIQTKKLIGSKKQTKAKVLLGKGRKEFMLSKNNHTKLVRDFSPIFDLNSESKELPSSVLSSSIDKIFQIANQYITTDSLHNIEIPLSNNNVSPVIRKLEINNTFNSMNNTGKTKYFKKKLENIYDDKKVEYFQGLLEKIKSNYNTMKAKLTIAQFNIISLQLILLFTEILYYIYGVDEDDEDNDEMIYFNYFSYGERKNNYITEGTDYWDYSKLEGRLLSEHKSETNTYCYLIQTKDGIPYENEIKPSMYIILFLGELTLEDLIKAYINQIYVMGMTMEMQYADELYSTPFGFFMHDVGHSNDRFFLNRLIRDNITEITSNEKKFFNFIKQQPLNSEEKHDIELVLFLMIHETINEFHLQEQNIQGGSKLLYNNYKGTYELSQWAQKGMYNSLLPNGRSIKVSDGNSDKTYQLDDVKKYKVSGRRDPYKEILTKVLETYLINISRLFADKWNECFAK